MWTYIGVEVQFNEFLTWALGGGKLSASSPGRFILDGKNQRHPLERRICGHGRVAMQKGTGIDGTHFIAVLKRKPYVHCCTRDWLEPVMPRGREFESRPGKVFSTSSRSNLGLSGPLVQRVLRTVLPEVKPPEREA
jgi:hypothetical protein